MIRPAAHLRATTAANAPHRRQDFAAMDFSFGRVTHVTDDVGLGGLLGSYLHISDRWRPAAAPGRPVVDYAAAFQQAVEASPAVRAWLKLVPTSFAMAPMYRPDLAVIPGTERVKSDAVLRSLAAVAPEAVAARFRAVGLQWFIAEEIRQNPSRQLWKMTSFGSGPGYHLQGVGALFAAARTSAELRGVDTDIHALNALKTGDTGIALVTAVTGSVLDHRVINTCGTAHNHLVDCMGVCDYLDDAQVGMTLRNGNSLLVPGGAMVISNTIPAKTAEANARRNRFYSAVGWPRLKERTPMEFRALVAGSGFSPSDVRIISYGDGMQPLYVLRKPEK